MTVSQPPETPLPVLRLVCTGLLTLVIGLIVFWPDPGDVAGSSGLTAWLDAFHAAGGPAWVSLPHLEFAANVVMFVPVGAVAWWWKASVVRDTLIGFAATIFIEVVQGIAVPGRVSDFRDIVANTLGALLGSLICAGIELGIVRHARRRASRRGGPDR